MADRWMDVTVKVETDRLGEFYQLVGRFLSGDGLPSRGPSAELASWDESDIDAAHLLLTKLSAPARRLFEILGTSAGQRYAGDELATLINIENGRYGIAGTLAWPGRYCKAMGRRLPIEWDEEAGGYFMSKEIASLFAAARNRL